MQTTREEIGEIGDNQLIGQIEQIQLIFKNAIGFVFGFQLIFKNAIGFVFGFHLILFQGRKRVEK